MVVKAVRSCFLWEATCANRNLLRACEGKRDCFAVIGAVFRAAFVQEVGVIKYLLLASVAAFCCIIGNKFSRRLGVPTLLIFILLGLMFGAEGLIPVSFDELAPAEKICTAGLVLIIFYGGFGTGWSEAGPVAVKAGLLSSLGTVLTALLTGGFCHLVWGFSLPESLLIGAVLGSTDAASVFSILRSKKLNLRYGTASILEVESGSNDPFASILTVVVLAFLKHGGENVGGIVETAAVQVAGGLASGAVLGLGTAWLMRRVRLDGSETTLMLAVAAMSYALPESFGGNGYLSCYITGILLGNSRIPHKRELVHDLDGISGLTQMIIFFILGLLSFPSQLPRVLTMALPIALFMTFAARPIAVFVLLTPLRCPLRQQALIAWAGLRGAASIVFAIMVLVSGVHLESDLFHIVFAVVLFSIAFQGTLLPFMARRLGMISENEDVMRTFSDYAEDSDVQFVRVSIRPGHAWENLPLRELELPPGLVIAAVQHAGKGLVPDGDTVLRAGDTVIVLGASEAEDAEISGVRLLERELAPGNPWAGKRIADLRLPPAEHILLIRRGGHSLIPNADSVLLAGDVLVLNSGEN